MDRQKKARTWKQFIKAHWDSLCGCDFFTVIIKEPEVCREISGAMLSAWLAMPGKNPKEQALKVRLGDHLRQ